MCFFHIFINYLSYCMFYPHLHRYDFVRNNRANLKYIDTTDSD